MQLPINLSIAETHLLSRKRQSIVAMLGVTFGIAMFILMMSFMKGMNEWFQAAMMAAIPDIHVYNDVTTDYTSSIAGDYFKETNKVVAVAHPKPRQVNLNLKNPSAILTDLSRNPNVAVVSPSLSTQVFYNYGPVQINGFINGVNIMEESKLYGLAERMVAGRVDNLLTASHGIIIGRGLARKLNVQMDDLVSLTTPVGSTMRFRIVGIFQFGIAAVDDVKSYVNLTSVQQLLGKNRDYITDINIKFKDNKLARAAAKELNKKYNYKAEDWETANASIKAGNFIRDVFTYVISIALLTVAGFGIYNIMNMTIANKLKDIAILKAQGFDRRDIIQIFLSESLVIGVLGALSGIILGFLFSYALSRVPWPQDEYFSLLKYFPVVFRPSHYVFGIFFGMVTTLLAGLMPSIKASRIDPVAILRG